MTKKLFHSFPIGMTATVLCRNTKYYINLVVYNADQSEKKTFSIRKENHKELYKEALAWLREYRHDVEAPDSFPYTWRSFVKKFNLEVKTVTTNLIYNQEIG